VRRPRAAGGALLALALLVPLPARAGLADDLAHTACRGFDE
jgi:hypothetical protein